LRAYSAKSGIWPSFSGSNHLEYMDNLITLMGSIDISPPQSNTKRSYIYRIKRVASEDEDILLLCFSDRIILYGISKHTFARVDRFIDGIPGEEKGLLTGRPTKDGKTMIGVWRL
jgi:hypothetical protein